MIEQEAAARKPTPNASRDGVEIDEVPSRHWRMEVKVLMAWPRLMLLVLRQFSYNTVCCKNAAV